MCRSFAAGSPSSSVICRLVTIGVLATFIASCTIRVVHEHHHTHEVHVVGGLELQTPSQPRPTARVALPICFLSACDQGGSCENEVLREIAQNRSPLWSLVGGKPTELFDLGRHSFYISRPVADSNVDRVRENWADAACIGADATEDPDGARLRLCQAEMTSWIGIANERNPQQLLFESSFRRVCEGGIQ